MIRSFGDKETEKIWNRQFSSKLPEDIQQAALNRLLRINAASNWMDLGATRGNGFEKLKDNLAGKVAVRINDQWRICFHFDHGEATEVSIVEYHRRKR